MKTGSQKLQSPPPKPPRRRYSDQISVSSIGAALSCKKNDEIQPMKNDSQIGRSNTKPNYISLPASWISNFSVDCANVSTSPKKFSLRNQFTFSKESDINKTVAENSKTSKYCVNEYSSEETQPSYLKYDLDNFLSCCTAKYSRQTEPANNDVFVVSSCYGNFEIIKSLSGRSVHRRHHSDSAIFCPDISNENNSFQSNGAKDFDLPYCPRKLRKCVNKCKSCTDGKKKCFLLQEIKYLKEINDKLWKHICYLHKYLDNARKKTNENSSDDISLSGLLSSIYYAQRAKDLAMEERLKIAFEERDAALVELEDMICVMTKSLDELDSAILKEKELAENLRKLCGEGPSLKPSTLLKYQQKLLMQVPHLKYGHSQETKHVISERDKALEKVSELEEDIRNLHLCYGLFHVDNKNWELTLFDILRELVLQRDSILPKIDKGLHIDNRSQVEENFIPSINSLYRSHGMHKSHSMHVGDFKELFSLDTCEDTKKLKGEILFLNKALESEIKRREQAERKCIRFERVIHLLRKKLNGQNIGVLV